MQFHIDPTFASWLPLILYCLGCYCAVMIGKGLEYRRKAKEARKDA